jgi:hypothetical protein
MLYRAGPAAPFFERKGRASRQRSQRPTTAVQENGAYGGQGKAVGFPRPTALLSELQPFCAARHFAKKRTAVGCVCAWYQKAESSPQWAAEGRNLGLDGRLGPSGPLFCARNRGESDIEPTVISFPFLTSDSRTCGSYPNSSECTVYGEG